MKIKLHCFVMKIRLHSFMMKIRLHSFIMKIKFCPSVGLQLTFSRVSHPSLRKNSEDGFFDIFGISSVHVFKISLAYSPPVLAHVKNTVLIYFFCGFKRKNIRLCIASSFLVLVNETRPIPPPPP